MEQRHAFLVTAYDNLSVLEKLILLLDDPRNDIYLHLDVKMGNLDQWLSSMRSKVNTNIFTIDRIDIAWGAASYTRTILELLAHAVKNGGYSWYHHLTGTSLPIRRYEEMYQFFASDSRKLLYFHINHDTYKVIQDRVKAYYPFIDSPYFRKSKMMKGLSLLCGKTQIALGVNRLRNSRLYPLYNGWQLFSVPDDFAKYAVQCKDEINKTFRYTLAPDEVWIQSLAMHSPFAERVYGNNGRDDPIDASKHYVDWKRGKPYTFTKDDFDILINDNHGAFWAR